METVSRSTYRRNDTRTQINRTRTRETRARVRFFVRTCNICTNDKYNLMVRCDIHVTAILYIHH